jgi:hypothetical protein
MQPAYYPANAPQESFPVGLAIVSGIFPCIGLIAWIVYLCTGKPLHAKAAGYGTLVGGILGVVIVIGMGHSK